MDEIIQWPNTAKQQLKGQESGGNTLTGTHEYILFRVQPLAVQWKENKRACTNFKKFVSNTQQPTQRNTSHFVTTVDNNIYYQNNNIYIYIFELLNFFSKESVGVYCSDRKEALTVGLTLHTNCIRVKCDSPGPILHANTIEMT